MPLNPQDLLKLQRLASKGATDDAYRKIMSVLYEMSPYLKIMNHKDVAEMLVMLNNFSEKNPIVFLDKTTYYSMLKSEMKLAALEAGGVDNWSYYGEVLNEDNYLEELREIERLEGHDTNK